MSEKLTELELADAVLDVVERYVTDAIIGDDFLGGSPMKVVPEARVRLEALFRDLRARGAL